MSRHKYYALYIILSSLILLLYNPLLFPQTGLGKGRINGTVVDEKGKPIQQALIVAQSLKYKGTKLQAYSDAKGDWAIGGLGSGYWRITATKKGYSSSFVEMNVSQIRINPPITFTLQKATGAAIFLIDNEASAAFELGNKLMEEKKYDEAIETFQQLLADNPDIYQVHLNLGECYMNKGEMDKAAEEFNKVLQEAELAFNDYKRDVDSSSRAFSGLAQVALKKGDLKSAQSYFAQALEISPQNEVLAYNVGEIYFAHQEIDSAIKYFQQAIEIKKDWSPPYLKLGYTYLHKGDNEKALESLTKFLQLDPESPDAPIAKQFVEILKKEKQKPPSYTI